MRLQSRETSNERSPIYICRKNNSRGKNLISSLSLGDPFIKGKRYPRKSIHQLYNGHEQGGISTPRSYPYIFIFTGESGNEYGYQGSWSEDKNGYYYTGEGQRGPMEFIKGNRAIRNHLIYLFQYIDQGIVGFVDEF